MFGAMLFGSSAVIPIRWFIGPWTMALIIYFLHQLWNVLVFLWLQDRNSSPLLCPLAVLCFVPLIKSYLTSGTVYIIMIKYIYNNVQMVKRELNTYTNAEQRIIV